MQNMIEFQPSPYAIANAGHVHGPWNWLCVEYLRSDDVDHISCEDAECDSISAFLARECRW